jgi:hypothetical protein
LNPYEAAEKLVDLLREKPAPGRALALLAVATLIRQRAWTPSDLTRLAQQMDDADLVAVVKQELYAAIASHKRRSDGVPPGPVAA